MGAAGIISGRCWRALIRSLHTGCRHGTTEPVPATAAALGCFESAASSTREVGVLLGGLRRHGVMPSWNVDHGIRWMSGRPVPRAGGPRAGGPRAGGPRTGGPPAGVPRAGEPRAGAPRAGVAQNSAREEEDEDGEDDEGDNLGIAGQSFAQDSLQSQLLNAPRRKRRYLMERALKIRTTQTPEFDGQKMEMKVIDVNRTCKVTKGGGVMNFTAFVICGNSNGVVGFGKGKSAEVPGAVNKAYLRAMSNLHYFEPYHGHTIYRPHDTKYGKTKIYLWPAKPGVGMRASHTVGGILRLAGFKDVKTKIVGSRHPHNTVKAVFKALSEIEVPDDQIDELGLTALEAQLKSLSPEKQSL